MKQRLFGTFLLFSVFLSGCGGGGSTGGAGSILGSITVRTVGLGTAIVGGNRVCGVALEVTNTSSTQNAYSFVYTAYDGSGNRLATGSEGSLIGGNKTVKVFVPFLRLPSCDAVRKVERNPAFCVTCNFVKGKTPERWRRNVG